MYNEAEEPDSTYTAFRLAEKKYKKHVDVIKKFRNGRPNGTRQVERPTDLSDVVDVDSALLPSLTTVISNGTIPSLPQCRMFSFSAHPGFLLVRDALPVNLKRRLCIDCFTAFPSPPATTNFDRTHSQSLPGLWEAHIAGLRLSQDATGALQDPIWVNEGANASSGDGNNTKSGVPAAQLLRRLRWASIGPNFDWTSRMYVRDKPYMLLPGYLVSLAQQLATAAAAVLPPADLEFFDPGSFLPDAALVNYYYDGDTLMGHVDDAESDLSHPLVSLSVGRPGIFLLGGFTKDTQPTAVLLRSGDAVVLAGAARRCVHGVPRVFLKREMKRGKRSGSGSDVAKNSSPEGEEVAWGEVDAAFRPFAEHMERCRINISVRHVAASE